ncbi:hypothetical protein T439DRAFT_359590 [Meredithblackwellia eburnea MCA 4105]
MFHFVKVHSLDRFVAEERSSTKVLALDRNAKDWEEDHGNRGRPIVAPFHCSRCEDKFTTPDLLADHEVTHVCILGWFCHFPECLFKFYNTRMTGFKEHFPENHGFSKEETEQFIKKILERIRSPDGTIANSLGTHYHDRFFPKARALLAHREVAF